MDRTTFYRPTYCWGDSNFLGGADQRPRAAALEAETISSRAALPTVTLPNRVQLDQAQPAFIPPVCSIFQHFCSASRQGKDSMLIIQNTRLLRYVQT